MNASRFFGGQRSALRAIEAALSDAKKVRIATAYFEASGYQCLENVLSNKQIFLMVGREQGARDRLEDVITEFVDSLSAGTLIGRTAAMRLMLES